MSETNLDLLEAYDNLRIASKAIHRLLSEVAGTEPEFLTKGDIDELYYIRARLEKYTSDVLTTYFEGSK